MDKQRFSRYEVFTLDTSGFDDLSANDQHLIYHLSMSGIVARDIRFLQTSRYSLPVKQTLEAMLTVKETVDDELFEKLSETYKIVAVSGGIYHESKGDRVKPLFTRDEFDYLAALLPEDFDDSTVEQAATGLFSEELPALMTPNDPLEPAGFVTHDEDITPLERKLIISGMMMGANAATKDTPMVGLNAYLTKKDGEFEFDRFSVKSKAFDGKLARMLNKSCEHLTEALKYCKEKPYLAKTIETLIAFYQSGDTKDFDTHCLAWLEHSKDGIYFVHGFIEEYDDPLKQMGSFEVMVGFENKKETQRIRTLVEMAQYVEDSLPTEPQFKRQEAKGVMGSATVLVGFAGSASPVLPLGNCLPNSDWIRARIGSSSTNFSNVIETRGPISPELCARFIAPVHQEEVMTYVRDAFFLMVNLHECMGHASGTLAEGIKGDELKDIYSVIEECRADLVAYYKLADPHIVTTVYPHVTDTEAFARAAYADYLTNGSLLQLYRLTEDTEVLGAAHFRNRQLNNLYVLEKGLQDGFLRWVDGPYGRCIEVLDVKATQAAFGELLNKIQTIKSTGDKAGAIRLAERFGTHVCKTSIADAHRRVADFNPPAFSAFTTPFFEPTGDEDKPYVLKTKPSFLADQLALSALAASAYE